MSTRRIRMLLFGLCVLVTVGAVVVYNSVVAFEPTLRRGLTDYETTQAVVDYIRNHTRPDERIFTIDHTFAALSQRRIVGDVSTGLQIRSAWHLNGFPYATPHEIINLMRKGEGKYVIMDPHTNRTLKKWTPALFYYIMNAYTVEEVIHDIQIMVRAQQM